MIRIITQGTKQQKESAWKPLWENRWSGRIDFRGYMSIEQIEVGFVEGLFRFNHNRLRIGNV